MCQQIAKKSTEKDQAELNSHSCAFRSLFPVAWPYQGVRSAACVRDAMSFAAAVPRGGWLAAGTDVLVPCRCSREVKAAPLSIFPEPSAAELRGGECWLLVSPNKISRR